MQKRIDNEAPHEVFFASEKHFFRLQSNYGNEIIFTTHTPQFMPHVGLYSVAIFKVKPTSKPLSERLRQSKYIRAKSIMEIADEIIYEALKNEAA